MAIVEGAYFIKLIIGLWAPGEEGQEAKEEYAVREIKLFNFGKVIIVFVLSLIILGAGIFPDLFGDLISKDHKLLNETGTVFELDIMKGGD
jgi:multicomponent Na+:H+ antiporter subunit D